MDWDSFVAKFCAFLAFLLAGGLGFGAIYLVGGQLDTNTKTVYATIASLVLLFIFTLLVFNGGDYVLYRSHDALWRKLQDRYQAELAAYPELLHQFQQTEEQGRAAFKDEQRRWETEHAIEIKMRRLWDTNLFYCRRHDIVFLHPSPSGLRTELANGVSPDGMTWLLLEAARLS